MANNINCTCGHSWSKASSSKKDMYVCHICGKDNTMKDGGWLDNYGKKPNPNEVDVSVGPGFVGMGNDTTGRNYSPAWGGQFQDGGNVAQKGKSVPTTSPSYQDSLNLYNKWNTKLAGYKTRPTTEEEKKQFKDEKTGIEPTTVQYKGSHKYFGNFPKPTKPTEKVEPIIVNDPKDPRFQAYRDSLDLYNRSMYNHKQLMRPDFSLSLNGGLDVPFLTYSPINKNNYQRTFKKDEKDGYLEYVEDQALLRKTPDPELKALKLKSTYDISKRSKIRPVKNVEYNYGEGPYGGVYKTNMLFKKPVQPVEYEKSEETKTEETKLAPYTPKGSKKYIVNGMEVSEEDFLGSGATTGGSKRIIYNTPNKGTQQVLRLDGTPETDPDKIRRALATANKDDNMAMGGSLPGAVGFTYARTINPAPSNGKYAKKTKASAQNGKEMKFYQEGLDFKPNSIAQDGRAVKDETMVKKPITTSSIVDSKKQNVNFLHKTLQRYARDMAQREQPTFSTWDPLLNADARKQLYEEAESNKLKNKLLQAADVATDLMQIGNFIPNPVGQSIGKVGNVIGGWLDAYQAANAFDEGNYEDAAINLASVALPMTLGSSTFRRNSKYLQPGQPLNFLKGSKRVNYIEPFTKVKGMTNKSLMANRALLGTLGAETAYDSYQDGGAIVDPMGQWAHPGEVTIIPGTDITMEGVDYPVLGISDTGDQQMMYPGEDYDFDGEYVTEYPMAQDGKKLKNVKGESEKFLKGWMDSPMYEKMINASINASPNQQEERLKAINREDRLKEMSWEFADLNADKSWLDKLSSPILGQFVEDKNKVLLNPSSNNDKLSEVGVHELSHATDLAGANIPSADVEKMWKYQKQREQEKGKLTKFFDDKDFNTYVGRPTETRARLNAIRYLGKKEGIYDPYREKVNKDILKKLPSSIFHPTELDQLRLIYSDDQIIDLLNSVSKNDSNKLIPQAQDGGWLNKYK